MMILSKLTILHSTQPLQIFDGWPVSFYCSPRGDLNVHTHLTWIASLPALERNNGLFETS